MKNRIHHNDTKTRRKPRRLLCVLCAFVVALLLLIFSAPAFAWSGRRAVLYTRGEVMLTENLSWKQQDCTSAVWRMLRDLWPELRLTKWFHRTTADAMAGWPWPAVMRREDMVFGDLVFTGHPKIGHVLVHWVEPETAVHAAKSKGFSLTGLKPYWWPKIAVIVRPPY